MNKKTKKVNAVFKDFNPDYLPDIDRVDPDCMGLFGTITFTVTAQSDPVIPTGQALEMLKSGYAFIGECIPIFDNDLDNVPRLYEIEIFRRVWEKDGDGNESLGRQWLGHFYIETPYINYTAFGMLND